MFRRPDVNRILTWSLATLLLAGCGPLPPNGSVRSGRRMPAATRQAAAGEPALAAPAPDDVRAAVAVARAAHDAWIRHDLDRVFALMHPQSVLVAGAHGKLNGVFNKLNDERDAAGIVGRENVDDFDTIEGIALSEARSIVEETAAPDRARSLVADPVALAHSVVILGYDVEGRGFRDVLARDGAAWRMLTPPCNYRWPREGPKK